MSLVRGLEEKFQPIEAFDTAFDKKLRPQRNLTIKVPIYGSNGTLADVHEYHLDATKELGHSETSKVYSATRTVKDNKGNLVTKSFAIKIMQHPAASAKPSKNATEIEKIKARIARRLTEIQNEVKFFRYAIEKPLLIDEKIIILISESLPGLELCSDDGVVHPDLHKLNFTQRTKAAAQLMTQLNELHHTKPSTGNALIHADLKGSNVKLSIDPDTLDTEVFVIDYGIALEAKETEQALTAHPYRINGSHVYFPLETQKSQFGLKTDLYMVVAPLIVLFGETAPYRIKVKGISLFKELSDDEKTIIFKKPYPLDKVMASPRLYLDLNVRELMLNMLNRMQSNVYDDRPDTDEATLFFVLLNKLARVDAVTPHDNCAKATIIAKMWLLTTNEWYKPVNRPNAPLSATSEYNGKTFNEFDFGKDTLTTLSIISLCNRDLKRNAIGQAETPSRSVLARRARAIAILSEKQLLDNDIAVIIGNDNPLSDVVVATTLGEKPALTPENIGLFFKAKVASSSCRLVQLVAHNGDWETAAHLLMLIPNTALDSTLTKFLQQNAETLISVANRIFKGMNEGEQLAFVNQTIQRHNALGALLNTPSNSIGFLFTSRKFADVKITHRTERLISDLACYQSASRNLNVKIDVEQKNVGATLNLH
jgi:serine/threonine protein kinase